MGIWVIYEKQVGTGSAIWRKYSSTRFLSSLDLHEGIGGTVDSPHKGPLTRKMFSFDDVFMATEELIYTSLKWFSTRFGGRFKNTYELLNLRAVRFSPANKIYIFQCMGKIFCVEFQRYPLKFHTKYHTHTLKDMIFIQRWNFKSS